MPQLLKGQLVNVILTGLAQGFAAGDCKADQLFPVIKTPKNQGTYIKWDTNSLRATDTSRGYSARVKSTDYDYSTGTYTLPPGYTGAVKIDRRLVEQNEGIPQLNMARQKLNLKLADMAREKELKAANLLTNIANWSATAYGNVTNAGVAGSGADVANKGWARSDTDISGDIFNAIKTIQTNFGTRQNLVMGVTFDVWTAMRRNTALKSYFYNTIPGAAANVFLNETKFAADFGLEEVVILDAIYTNSAGTTTNVWGSGFCAIVHRPKAPAVNGPVDPSLLPPAAGWTIQRDGYPYVTEHFEDETTSDVYTNHDNYLHLMTSNIAGYNFQSVLS